MGRGHALRKRGPETGDALEKRAAACNSPYISPAEGETVRSFDSVQIVWNADCFDAAHNLDIYVFPGPTLAAQGIANVGSWTTQLNPASFNLTSAGEVSLQLSIVEATEQPWMHGIGPHFNLAFNGSFPAASASQTVPANSGPGLVQVDPSPASSSSGISGGKLAAAILLPILAVVAMIAVYVVWQRRKSLSTTKRWSHFVDQRLSTVVSNPQPQMGDAGRRASAYSFTQPQNSAGGGTHSRRQSGVLTHRRSHSYGAQLGLSPEQDSPAVLSEADIARMHARHDSVEHLQQDQAFMAEPALRVAGGLDRLSRLERLSKASSGVTTVSDANANAAWQGEVDEETLQQDYARRVSHPDAALSQYAASRGAGLHQRMRSGPEAAAWV